MPKPTPFSLSKLFTQLIGRKVVFASMVAPAENSIDQVYGIYDLVLFNTAVVVQADLNLLGAFAGALMGLPGPVVKERLRCDPIDDLLHDAMHEVFNVISGAIANQGRTVFTAMTMDRSVFTPAAAACYSKPGYRSYFNVTVDGYTGGRFAIFAPPLLWESDSPYWQG